MDQVFGCFFVAFAVYLLFTLKKKLANWGMPESVVDGSLQETVLGLGPPRLRQLCPVSLIRRGQLLSVGEFLLWEFFMISIAISGFTEVDILHYKITEDFTLYELLLFCGWGLCCPYLIRKARGHWRIAHNPHWILDSSEVKTFTFFKMSPIFKVGLLCLALLWGGFVWISVRDGLPSISDVLISIVLPVLFLSVGLSEQSVVGEPGFLNQGVFIPWSKVVEYRWFRDRTGMLVVCDRWSLQSPLLIIPLPTDNTEEAAALLEQKLSGKRREDVETALEQLQPTDDSLSAEQSPA